MKIILTGGSGFIGRRLVEKFATAGHEVIVLTRDPASLGMQKYATVKAKHWDGKTTGAWISEVDGADAVLNFAGESIGGKRWTSKQKEKILSSRIDATRALIDAMKQAKKKPAVLVNASAVGYYGPVEEAQVTEAYPAGNDFLAHVCRKWEREALAAEQLGVRVVLLRQGVVLDNGGGALERMALPFKMFVGGPVGSGRQWFPWIHRDDAVHVALFATENRKMSGPVNVVAPEQMRMKEFSRALGKAMHRPSMIPVPGFVLKLALGEMSGMVLTGQRVVPEQLFIAGFSYFFPHVDDALTEIFS